MTEQDLEYEYNPRISTPDVEHYLEQAALESERIRPALNGHYDVRYGPQNLMTCDIFPAGPDAPVHVFIHGGYWKSRDKSDYSFMVPAFLEAGITLIIPNYDLCPDVDLTTLVRQTASCLDWVKANGQQWGGDTSRISASGHSAGAHLLAMALSPGFEQPVAPDVLQRAVLISGLFELDPVARISVNNEIQLTPDLIEQLSPMRHRPYPGLELDILVGGDETTSWIRQSEDYHAFVKDKVAGVRFEVLPGHNHFSIVAEFSDPRSPVTRACIEAALNA